MNHPCGACEAHRVDEQNALCRLCVAILQADCGLSMRRVRKLEKELLELKK